MKFWTRFPLFRFLIPFGAGILNGLYCNIFIYRSITVVIIAFLVSWLFAKNSYATGKYAWRWLAGIPFYTAFWALGSVLVWISDGGNYHSHFSSKPESSVLIVQTTEPSTETKKGIRVFTKVQSLKICDEWIPARGNLVIYIRDTSHQLKIGFKENILIAASCVPVPGPTNPGAFDFRDYLRNKGIYHQTFIDKNDLVIMNSTLEPNHFSIAYELRENLLQKISKYIDHDESGVAAALLLGYEGWLDPEQEQSYSNAGVLHVLCVSGMHVALVYNILAWLMGWMDKKRFTKHLKYFSLLILIWFYAMITGFSPSVIRAAAMISFVIFGKWVDRNASIYNLLCGSCFLLFIFDPFLIRSTGFVLSFLAVCGIIFYHKLILPLWVPPNKIMFLIWELTSVSLAAQLTTFPLSMYLFHQFPNYFLIANLIIIPLSTGVMYSGLLILVTDWLPLAGMIFGWVTTKGITLLNLLVNGVACLPGALTTDIYITGYETLLIYSGMILFTTWLTKKSLVWLKLTMVSVILFLSSKIYSNHETQSQNTFTVYQVPKTTLFSLIHGQRAILFGDSTIPSSKVNQVLKTHFLKHNIYKTDTVFLQSDRLYELHLNSTNKILFTNNPDQVKDYKNLDDQNVKTILILGRNCKLSAHDLVLKFNPTEVVIDNTMNKVNCNRLIQEFNSLNIPVSNLKSEGAFSVVL